MNFSDPEFWEKRIKESSKWEDAIQGGVDWEEVNKYHKEILKQVSGKVLDVGCGYGRIIDLLPKDIDYTGIDISPDFIAEARKRYPNHKFILGDIRKIDFEDKFDWAIVISMGGYPQEKVSEFYWELERELTKIAKKILVLWLSKPREYKIITYGTI